jgi:hypothetical protein
MKVERSQLPAAPVQAVEVVVLLTGTVNDCDPNWPIGG